MSQGMNYSFEFPFEKNFDQVAATLWMENNWTHSITLSFLYVASIYAGEYLMRNRSALKFKSVLTVWNCLLATFSIMGCFRMTPEFVHSLRNFGFEYSMCNTSFAHIKVTAFWTEMFAKSKVLEFGDTIFLVLHKRPVIFLHWYHHITVLMYTWHAFKEYTAAGRWFIWMNYTVHSIMYSYFALRSLGLRFPKFIPMAVTVLQLTQMVVGCFIAINAYRIKLMGGFCQQTYNNLYFSFAIYFTYFLLFANFFHNAYVRRGNKYTKKDGQETAKKVE